MFEQQIQQLQQQLQLIEQGIIELDSLALGLNDLEGGSGKEILAPVGRGIFAKTKLVSEELTVDVGGKNFVKKSVNWALREIGKRTVALNKAAIETAREIRQIQGAGKWIASYALRELQSDAVQKRLKK